MKFTSQAGHINLRETADPETGLKPIRHCLVSRFFCGSASQRNRKMINVHFSGLEWKSGLPCISQREKNKRQHPGDEKFINNFDSTCQAPGALSWLFLAPVPLTSLCDFSGIRGRMTPLGLSRSSRANGDSLPFLLPPHTEIVSRFLVRSSLCSRNLHYLPVPH